MVNKSIPLTRFKRAVPDVYAALVAQDWKISLTSRGHVRVVSPTNKVVTGSMAHISDPHAVLNFTRDVARAGLDLNMKSKPVVRKEISLDTVQPEDISERRGWPEPHGMVNILPPARTEFVGMLDEIARDEWWPTAQVKEYLGARNSRPDELADWLKAGLLERVWMGKGYKYLSGDVIDFKNSETYAKIHKPHRAYRRKAGPVVTFGETDIQDESPLAEMDRKIADAARISVVRHSSLVDELEPVIERAVAKAVREVMERIVEALR